MEEQWLPVTLPGFESLYEVSNLGCVRTLQQRPMILSPRLRGFGYYKVNLANGKIRKLRGVHRLVALAFIPNPEGKGCVNHKDNDPKNNRVDNLEWMTPQENRAYTVSQNRHAKGDRIRNGWAKRNSGIHTRKIFTE
jgi:hypothetical protein